MISAIDGRRTAASRAARPGRRERPAEGGHAPSAKKPSRAVCSRSASICKTPTSATPTVAMMDAGEQAQDGVQREDRREDAVARRPALRHERDRAHGRPLDACLQDEHVRRERDQEAEEAELAASDSCRPSSVMTTSIATTPTPCDACWASVLRAMWRSDGSRRSPVRHILGRRPARAGIIRSCRRQATTTSSPPTTASRRSSASPTPSCARTATSSWRAPPAGELRRRAPVAGRPRARSAAATAGC